AAVLDFSTDDLELSWPDVRERSQVLRSRSADDWAQQLRAAEEKLDAAIQSANPIAMRQQFRSYRRKAGDRFYRVDVDLKRLCDELVTVGEALAAVLRYME
ncbi:MAG: CHAT domain-containing protein, partial [Chloroflexi bacterium]|nr:CHAT domain-containing protein [Chloroflexota bacterium]